MNVEEALLPALIGGNLDEIDKILRHDPEAFPINSRLGDKFAKGSGQFLEPTALTVASKYGHAECVRKILELGGNLYSVGTTEDEEDDDLNEASVYLSEDYFGALVIAASKDFSEIVHLLVEFRLFKVPGIGEEYAEFVKAAADRNFQCISTLLDFVVDKNVFLKGWKGHNIMNLCLLRGCPAWCLQTILDHGITVNGWDFNGLTPLMCAIIGKNLECLEYLLDKGADPYAIHILRRMSFQDDGSILYFDNMGHEKYQARKDDWSVFYEDHVGPTALMYAAALGNIPILERMLNAANKDISALGRFRRFQSIGPLDFAVDYASVEAVSLILQFDDAKIELGTDPLCHAIQNGNMEMFEVLLDCGIVWDDLVYKEAMFTCVRKDNSQCLERILGCVDTNVFEIDFGLTLFFAIGEGISECVKILIKRPEFSIEMRCCDTNFTSAYWLTCFIFSCRKGRKELAQLFLELGAKINATDDSGKTSVMFAARGNHVDCLEFLMDLEADFDVVDEIGGTVFSAALMGDGSCLEFLLKSGRLLDKDGLKFIHKQSVNVFNNGSEYDGFGEIRMAISVKNCLLLMQYKLFHWKWCTMVDQDSLHNIVFAAVTSGIFPGQLTLGNRPQPFSLFCFAVIISDVATIRYLLTNLYFLPDDYRYLLSEAVKKFAKSADTVFVTQQLTLQPLSLKTWSAVTISERILAPDSVPNERNGLVERLPLPEGLKDILKFKTKFSELCPRHWFKLGPQQGANSQGRFGSLVVNGDTVQHPTLEKCAKYYCPCGNRGLTVKDLDNEV